MKIVASIYLAIPIGIIFFICPRLAEWFFHFDEPSLRFNDNCNEITNLGKRYYSYKMDKLTDISNQNGEFLADKNLAGMLEDSQNHNDSNSYNSKGANGSDYKRGQNIEMQDISKRKNKTRIEKNLLYEVSLRKNRAFHNFNKLVNTLILDVKKNLFVNEKHDMLSEDLAPLYSKRLNGQVENYEVRMYQIRVKLHQNEMKKQKEEKFEILKNRQKLVSDLKALLEGKDADLKEMETKCILL